MWRKLGQAGVLKLRIELRLQTNKKKKKKSSNEIKVGGK